MLNRYQVHGRLIFNQINQIQQDGTTLAAKYMEAWSNIERKLWLHISYEYVTQTVPLSPEVLVEIICQIEQLLQFPIYSFL